MLGNFACFSIDDFFKRNFRNNIRVSNSLDPADQAQQNVGPVLDPNCLQRESADATDRERDLK